MEEELKTKIKILLGLGIIGLTVLLAGCGTTTITPSSADSQVPPDFTNITGPTLQQIHLIL